MPPVVVLGMHRSGTSAVTRALNLLGVPLGETGDLMRPADDNPRGFWESRSLQEWNDVLLRSLGGSWDAPPTRPPGWEQTLDSLRPGAEQALRSVYGEADTFVWKDPRNCLLLPFWRPLLTGEPIVVLVHRNPRDVWRSLATRNAMSEPQALGLWETYNRGALEASRGLPTFVASYESLLASPRRWAEDVASFLVERGIAVDDAAAVSVEAWIDHDANHGGSGPAESVASPAVTTVRRELAARLDALAGPHARLDPGPMPDVVPLDREPDEPAGAVVTGPERSVPASAPARYPCSIVIPVFNKVELTARCLEALVETTPSHLYEVIIVDNASSDGTKDLLAALGGDVKVIVNEENLGFVVACNQGAAVATGEHLVFLNNDTEPQPGWLEALLERVEDPSVGAVGGKLVYPDGTLQEAGGIIFDDGSGWNFGKGDDPSADRYLQAADVDYCSGACLLVRTGLFREIGGFDSLYEPAYYEDTDLCFEVRRRGYRVMYEPGAVVVHHEGATAGTDTSSGYKRFQAINREKFVVKWGRELRSHGAPPRSEVDAPTTADRRIRSVVDQHSRVLVIDPVLPMYDRASGSLRLFRILESLVAAGHEVTYIARNGVGQGRYVGELQQMGIVVHPVDPERATQAGDTVVHPRLDLPGLLVQGRFDVALLSFFHLAEQYLPLLRRHSPWTRVVVDSVDLHYVREQRGAELAGDLAGISAALDTRDRELAVYAAADEVLVVSEIERAAIEPLVPGVPVRVVPNVHDVVDRVAPLSPRSGVLFVANFDHPPNRDAVAWLIESIMPIVWERDPSLELVVVGPNPPDEIVELEHESLTVTGHVPSTEPYLDAARVSVAPLRFGAGVKGKVGEALAHGLPVVTTSVGAEGMHLADGVDVMVADDAETFAHAILRLHGDDELWRCLSEHGRARVEAQFGRDRVARELEELVRRG